MTVKDHPPILTMVAGPNGSGKTTLTRMLMAAGVDLGIYVNPDDIAATLDGPYDGRVREAQRIADATRTACIAASRSFSFETVMSHPSKLDVLRLAREAGFRVEMFFVGIDDPQVNVTRVGIRVAQGGHDVPPERVVARWHRTMAQVADAIRLCDRALVYDNTEADDPRCVYVWENGAGEASPSDRGREAPGWVREHVVEALACPPPSYR